MKQFNLFIMCLLVAFASSAQETSVDLSLQPGYSDMVYYNFSTNTAENYNATAWEIAFMRTSSYAFAERINAAAGIEVYEASSDPADYATIDPTSIANWTRLYNSDTTWKKGAFDYGSATYGWGEYNATTHHVNGTVVFVLKYPDGNFKKMMIEDFSAGYTFKYATWDSANSTWINPQTVTLPNTDNQGQLFNYYSLSTNQAVDVAPNTSDWDMVFRKYTTTVNGQKYPVTGALTSPDVTVAQSTNKNASLNSLSFSDHINSIGYDWKSYDMDAGQYTVDSTRYYFLKYEDGTIYRFHFTAYDGSATGDFSLAYTDVTDAMAVDHFDDNTSFGIYPNPSTGRVINLLYETTQPQVQVAVYSITGKQVAQQTLKTNGFYTHKINLSDLSAGVYFVRFVAGTHTATKKLILK